MVGSNVHSRGFIHSGCQRKAQSSPACYAFPMPTFDFPTWFLSAMLAPFGLVLGSFANVLIHRLPQEAEAERDVVRRPSHCPSCKARIRPWHNIPLAGWLWLRGRCASCGWRIPVRYPLVELLGGRVPFVLLGTQVEQSVLFDLGNEHKAAAVYDLGARPGPFFLRLVQGILRRPQPRTDGP